MHNIINVLSSAGRALVLFLAQMRDIGYTWLPVSDPCSKHGPISDDFWDKRRYWSENLFPPVFKSPPPLRVLTSERRLGWKTGMMALAIWWWEKVWRFRLKLTVPYPWLLYGALPCLQSSSTVDGLSSTVLCALYSSIPFLMLIVSMLGYCPTTTFTSPQ